VIAVIGAFQALLSSVSLDLAITRFYYEWPDSVRRRNLGAIWSWNWIATLVTGGLFLLAFPVLGPLLFREVPFDPWLMLGIVGNMLANLFIVPASSIRIKRLPRLFAAYNLGGFAVSSFLGLWFVLILDQGLRGLIMSTIWSNLLLAVVGGIVMLRFSQPCLTSPGLGEALRFALPANPSQLINIAGSVLDRFLLSQFTSLQTLGVYSVSLKFVDVLTALHTSLKMTFGPFMMKSISADRQRGSELVVSVTPYYIIPYVAVVLGLSLFIGPVVRLINQPEYYDVVVWVPWLAGINVIVSLYFYYTNGLFLGNRTDLLWLPALVRLVALVVTGVLLLPPLQLTGIVISRYLSELVFLGLSLYLSQKIFHLAHRWNTLIGLGAAAVAFAVIGQFLTLDQAAGEMAAKAVVWAIFVGLSWWIVGGAHRSRRAGPVLNP
jgi:O-antigen/teichoic acid export membrane protein